MDVIKKSISALFLLFILTAGGNCFAQSKPNAPGNQRVQFYFDKPITLDSLTKFVHSHSKIRFSFNSSKVKGTKIINLKKGTYTIGSLLQQIHQHTSLYYSIYNGYVIFQDNPPKQKTVSPAVPSKTKPTPPVKKEMVAAHRKPVSKTITREPAENTLPQPVIVIDSTLKKDTTTVPVKPVKAGRPVVKDTTDEKVITIAIIPSSADRPLVIRLGDTSVVKNQSTTPKKKPAPVYATPPAAAAKKHERTRIARARSSNYGNGPQGNWQWQFGPQWKATIPLYGTQYYFTGTNTLSQPYNLLIPGIWVSAMAHDKHEIMLLVKPAEWYFYNKDPFRKDSGFVIRNFDSIPVKSNTRLIKTGGWYGSLQYNYHINEKWIVGAGIGFHLRSGGLAYQQSYKRFSDTLVTDSLYNINNSKDSIKYLSSSFISGKIELAYRFGALDAGVALLMPLTNPFTDKSLNKSRPLNAQLFIRWRINRRDEE
ncbi:hypothetical protein A3860_09840 [Niastella vici]|uniref:Secretin/TonB short N-terminal domain-containing protein n=1 Tax=Niastella vici TaxID=1703345 RepID=A0A1V9FEU5_9BACT|nr:hypothetical protein [Niastella vici]OQP56875.1 hypothetical protein A3860_09840 [Niastella vici]